MKRSTRRLVVAGGIVLLVMAALALLVPRLLPTAWITERIVSELSRATGAEVTLAEARLRWRGDLRITLGNGSVTGTGAALAAATGSANDLESYAVAVDELSVVAALWPLLRKKLEVKALELSGPRLSVRWKGGETSAAHYLLRLTDLHLGLDQPGAGVGSGPWGEGIPADLSFSLAAAADTLVLQNAPYHQLEMKGGFAARILEIPSLAAFRSTGRVTGNLSIDFTDNPWGHLVFAAKLREVPAGALLEPWTPEVGSRLECDLDAELTGAFDLGDKATVRRTLTVDGTMTGGPGILHAADWLREATPYLGDRQDLTEVRFRDLFHRFALAQGRYQFQEMTLSGGDSDWTGAGWLDLEGNIAMGVGVRLPAGYTPDLGGFAFLAQALRDAEGRINLPLTLTGKTARPSVGVDFSRLRGN